MENTRHLKTTETKTTLIIDNSRIVNEVEINNCDICDMLLDKSKNILLCKLKQSRDILDIKSMYLRKTENLEFIDIEGYQIIIFYNVSNIIGYEKVRRLYDSDIKQVKSYTFIFDIGEEIVIGGVGKKEIKKVEDFLGYFKENIYKEKDNKTEDYKGKLETLLRLSNKNYTILSKKDYIARFLFITNPYKYSFSD